MAANTFELPLAFDGHTAHLEVTHLQNGAWLARTKIDGRVLGWEQFTLRVQVDRYRGRMQQWLAQAEASERRLVSGAGRALLNCSVPAASSTDSRTPASTR